MKNYLYNSEDKIVALASPWAESPIAVIRTSGQDCIKALASCFDCKKPLTEVEANRILPGILRDPKNDEPLDQVMVAVYRSPFSYTGEESAEIFCHGNLSGIGRILKALRSIGFRDAEPGEFTFRAFLNGKMDLTRAEAVHEVVTAKSDTAFSLALNRLSGGVQKRIGSLREGVLSLASALELQLDYPEEEIDLDHFSMQKTIEAAVKEIMSLSSTYRVGRIYQEGVKVVIAGRTNAGKSSLFNLFLKEERSIVSEIHGTTRDYIEGGITLQGIPFTFYDTAGLRYADNPLEKEGIRRTENILERSDLILYLADGARGLSQEDEDFLNRYQLKKPCVKVFSKTDLGAYPVPEEYIGISTVTLEGFLELQEALVEKLLSGETVPSGSVVIDSLRQKELLDRAAESLQHLEKGIRESTPLDLLALDMKDVLDTLGEITGEITTEEILTDLFSRFCVGK